MDNEARADHYGCTGGWGGYCEHDLKVQFWNTVGDSCSSNWLFNNARVQRGQHGKNQDDAFDSPGWDCFNWSEVGCSVGNGFYVPNKVCVHYLKCRVHLKRAIANF